MARISAVAIFLAILAGGGCVYYMIEDGESKGGISIDGSFEDWSGTPTSLDGPDDSLNGNIDIIETGVTIDNVYTSFLVRTKEPMFTAEDGSTVRILIDSDNNQNSGYYYPGMGADHLVEVYGEDTGIVSTAMIYSFDGSRGRDDWNGFFSLTNIEANSTGAKGISTALELQIANFDMSINAGDGMRYLITASDSSGNTDVTNVIDLSRNEYLYEESVAERREIANSYYKGSLDGIEIDGLFNDWNSVDQFKADSNDSYLLDQSNILRFANFTDKAGETFYYINTEGNILDGTSFSSKDARNKGNNGGFDVTLGDGIEEIKYGSPTLSNEDQIFIFIDTDYNAGTGFSAGGIGAEKVIEIDGHYGIIQSSIMKTYVEIAEEWGTEIDVSAANDNDEIEILGDTGNYYIYIRSWNNDIDETETEIYNKITLPAEGEDGAKGNDDPTFPSSGWTLILTDGTDMGVNGDVDITTIHGQTDGTHFFVMITTESAVDITDSTIGIVINDVSNTGNDPNLYEAACSSHRPSTTNYGITYKWIGDAVWVGQGDQSDHDDHILVNNGHNGIKLACDIAFLGFTPDFLNDKIVGVSTDSDTDAFGDSWQLQNMPSSSVDDSTSATAIGIPEFSTLLMPIASVILIVGNRIRNKD